MVEFKQVQQRHALHFSNHLVPEIEAGVCPLACDDITHLNTINIIEYHWGSNSKGTKKFLNWHWIDLFQIDSSIQGSLKINILLPGPTPQSLVLSPQAQEAEEKIEKKRCKWPPFSCWMKTSWEYCLLDQEQIFWKGGFHEGWPAGCPWTAFQCGLSIRSNGNLSVRSIFQGNIDHKNKGQLRM